MLAISRDLTHLHRYLRGVFDWWSQAHLKTKQIKLDEDPPPFDWDTAEFLFSTDKVEEAARFVFDPCDVSEQKEYEQREVFPF